MWWLPVLIAVALLGAVGIGRLLLRFWRRRPEDRREGIRHHVGPVGAVAALLAAFGVTTAAFIIAFNYHYSTVSDQASVLGAILTGGIFLLAVIAGVIAVVSYAQAIR